MFERTHRARASAPMRPRSGNVVGIALVLAIGLTLSACGGDDGQPAASTVAAVDYTAACASLQGKAIGGASITAAKRIEAAGGLPGYCKVSATSGTMLDIEVDLPDNWTGRLMHQGGGGFDGQVKTVESFSAGYPLYQPLQRGVAYAASNGGNRTGDPSEFLTSQTEKSDYAYAAVGTTIAFAKAAVKAFYGRAPSHTYFNGASNGGRNAYIAAQRWPDQYDGIIAGAETMNMATQTAAWLNLARRAGSADMPAAAQWTALNAAAIAACDGLDGIRDGIIANPNACTFSPAALACDAPGADAATCLSPGQLRTVQEQVGPLSDSAGALVYAGYYWADFGEFLPYHTALGGGFAAIATGNAAWMLPATQPGSLQATFDVTRDLPPIAVGLQQAGADHDMRAIAQFVSSGKKLISWHGGADSLLSGRDHVRNFMAMTQLAGAGAANARFYLEPGVGHVQGGVGPDQVDYLGAMIDWVEKSAAPEQLLISKRDAQQSVVRTMPLCVYPKFPKYSGSGDANLAASYSCAMS